VPVLVHNCDTGNDPADLGDHTRADAARSPTNNQAASVARSTYTGQTAYGESGAVPGNVNPQLVPRLQAAEELVGTPQAGEVDWGPGECAEFHSCNNLLNQDPQSDLSDLEYYTVNKADGTPKPSCGWCQMILGGPGGATERTVP
jgi:hypothetical protein